VGNPYIHWIISYYSYIIRVSHFGHFMMIVIKYTFCVILYETFGLIISQVFIAMALQYSYLFHDNYEIIKSYKVKRWSKPLHKYGH